MRLALVLLLVFPFISRAIYPTDLTKYQIIDIIGKEGPAGCDFLFVSRLHPADLELQSMYRACEAIDHNSGSVKTALVSAAQDCNFELLSDISKLFGFPSHADRINLLSISMACLDYRFVEYILADGFRIASHPKIIHAAIENSFSKVLKMLIDERLLSTSRQDYSLITDVDDLCAGPVEYAAKIGNIEVINFFLIKGAEYSYGVLACAGYNDHINVLQRFENSFGTDEFSHAFHYALKGMKNLKTMEYFLGKGAVLSGTDIYSMIRNKSCELLAFILRRYPANIETWFASMGTIIKCDDKYLFLNAIMKEIAYPLHPELGKLIARHDSIEILRTIDNPIAFQQSLVNAGLSSRHDDYVDVNKYSILFLNLELKKQMLAVAVEEGKERVLRYLLHDWNVHGEYLLSSLTKNFNFKIADILIREYKIFPEQILKVHLRDLLTKFQMSTYEAGDSELYLAAYLVELNIPCNYQHAMQAAGRYGFWKLYSNVLKNSFNKNVIEIAIATAAKYGKIVFILDAVNNEPISNLENAVCEAAAKGNFRIFYFLQNRIPHSLPFCTWHPQSEEIMKFLHKNWNEFEKYKVNLIVKYYEAWLSNLDSSRLGQTIQTLYELGACENNTLSDVCLLNSQGQNFI